MNFDLSDEQKMLAEQARSLLAANAPFDHLRALIDQGAEWDEPLWRTLGEMGFLSAAISEEFGGLGLGPLELGALAQELGRANAAVPFASSIVLASSAIATSGSLEQKARWLPLLGSGEVVATFAYAEGSGHPFATGVELHDGRLTGVKTPVADAGVARLAVVLVKGGKLALVELDQAQVLRTKLTSFDQLRPHYRLEFAGAVAEAMPGEDRSQAIFDLAAVVAAFEAVGGADACLHMARDYALERRIFGRSLASYQSIKHKLADLAVAIELARSNAYFGAWAASESPMRLPSAAASARLTAMTAFETGARENLQVHGGIGYTFEADCHFFYRRERVHATFLASRQYWADRLIAHLPEARGEV